MHKLPLLIPLMPQSSIQLSHLTLRPHLVKVLNNLEIRIQKPIHTILCANLLILLQLPASDGTCDAFLPADVG